MAVRTDKPQVREPVVIVDAVDVVEVKDERPATPLRDAAECDVSRPARRIRAEIIL
jgi:hypothetical protein